LVHGLSESAPTHWSILPETEEGKTNSTTDDYAVNSKFD
jgi:hypothetical protein